MKHLLRFYALRLAFLLVATVIWSMPARAEITQENWCVLMESEPATSSNADLENESEEDEEDGDVVEEIPGVRAPRADEVGEPVAAKGPLTQSIPPLAGLPLDTSFDSVGWIPQGPGPARNGGSDIPAINPTDPPNPSAGAVQAIAPHPTDQNIMYIGTVNGGVWRTNNALATFPRWKALTDDQMSLSIGGLVIDPSDPSGNTLVAGIGRRSSMANLGGAHKGLLRTTNGGTTWTAVGTTALAGRSIYNLAVMGNIFLVAVPSTDGGGALPGLYRTTDGGVNFTNLSGAVGSVLPVGGVTHLAADPTNSTRFYLHVASMGVYRSVDSGATWTNISAGMAAANVADLDLAVGSGGTLFAAEVAATSRVYRSTNQGNNWTQMDSITAARTFRHNVLIADRANANLVYISGVSGTGAGKIFRGDASLALGSQWTSISSASSGGGTGPHTDSRGMAFTAGNRLIEGDDGGVYELAVANTGTGGGVTGSKWRSLLGNLQDGEMHSIAYDTVARLPFGGLQDNGSLKVAATGRPTWELFLSGDGGDAAPDTLISPGTTLRYGSAQYLQSLVAVTFDANNNQGAVQIPPTTLVGPGTAIVRGGSGNVPFYTPFATNAVVGGRLVIGGNANFYESTDQANTVRQVDVFGANSLARIAYGGRLNGVDASDVLFFGSGSTIRYRTTTGGAFGSVAYPDTNIQGIVFDPENWKNAYIVGTNTVYVANDIATNGAGGLTNVTGNLTGVGTLQCIEYLTLPSGNAIMVGTDLGAYIMRLSAPGVWKTLGDNLPHAPVYDAKFDRVGQVLVASTLGRGAWLYDCKQTKTTGQYGETFQAYVDGSSSLATSAGELFSTDLGTATKVSDTNLRELRLTANGTGFTRSAFRLPDLNPGRAVAAFSAKWNATLTGESGDLADGFSFNFGPLGGLAASFTNGTYANEDGFNAGLTVSVRTFSGNQPGYYVRVNGGVVAGGYIFKASSDWGNLSSTRHFFEVDWRMDTGLTLRVDGVAIFTNLATPGFFPAVGNRFVFGARTGASDEDVSLDNIAIFTGGVLAPIQATAPYHFSAEVGGTAAASKAFDGDVNTRWLALDYTGFIGASLPSAKTVRLYTLTSASDSPTRDLASWDFQTGNDGVLWTQHGAQTAQFFQNRSEQRAFVVVSPIPGAKFRVLISENHEAPELQLAEFQPWEFVPVSMPLSVTNTADSGNGSLRKAAADAAPFSGAIISIDPNLTGQTLTVTGGPIVLNTPDGVTITAPAVAGGGVIITSNNAGRMFNIPTSSSATFSNLALTGGNATGSFPNSYGGAMFNQGSTTLINCTLSGNHSQTAGGAIYSPGTLTITGCTFFNNSTGFGGAIQNEGNMEVTSSTFAGNTAINQGGAISAPFNHPVSLTQVTVSTNSAGTGGGTIGDAFTIVNSIVAGNTAPIDPNVSGSLTTGGANIFVGDPLLAPLDNYGGLTRTMALMPGSPARNSTLQSTATADQRGFPIVGSPDIGAYEAGTLTNYNAYIWELLPASATIAQHATTYDYDGDGMSNFNEFLAGTQASDAASFFRLINVSISGSNVFLTFPTVIGRNYTIEYSSDMVTWSPGNGAPFAGTGSNFTTPPLGPITGFNKLFLRVRTGP